MNPRGLIIAAPASGSGKTTITLGLLRYCHQQGLAIASAKAGPDYIDPEFHTAACALPCINLDSWAMRRPTLAALLNRQADNKRLILTEGVMGLFDGAADGSGSTAELARVLDWPVVLVIDAQGMAASAAALVHGFASFDPGIDIAGVIFNRIGGPGHAQLLIDACQPLGVPVLGCIPRNTGLQLPERHLGLVQAREHPALERFLNTAARIAGECIDCDRLLSLARPGALSSTLTALTLPPLGQRIAVARDDAFAFCYPFILSGWQTAGAAIVPFSPLNNESPAADADAVYLPGGYPELHAGRLAAQTRFMQSLRAAAQRQVIIYGECGGYMVLGQSLIDAKGATHAMAGLLPVSTSFADPRLHLGYRQLRTLSQTPFGDRDTWLRGHEFHYSRSLHQPDEATALFSGYDASGKFIGAAGCRLGPVMGSYAHLIDLATPDG